MTATVRREARASRDIALATNFFAAAVDKKPEHAAYQVGR